MHKVNFLLREIVDGYLNEGIPLAQIAHLDFHGKISLRVQRPQNLWRSYNKRINFINLKFLRITMIIMKGLEGEKEFEL